MVLKELSRAGERLRALDAERSSLSPAINLICCHLRVSKSGEMSARSPRMALISDIVRELEAIALQLGALIALVATRPLGEDLFKRN
jgi:hypothetical protein